MSVVRCPNNPLITLGSSRSLGENINGPSVIRVPSWIPRPLGRYYMYFAHHGGKFIRLAYADSLDGPWKVHEPGTLKREQTGARSHIASPDVHVDGERNEIRMYFHGDGGAQWSGVATSKDGLDFQASSQKLGPFYFRVFRWAGFHYALAKKGNEGWGGLYRSRDGLAPFEGGRNFVRMARHTAATIRGNHLVVFYSRKGDAPERILALTVALDRDWTQWAESEPIEVIRPEKDYEGIGYPNKPSDWGSATKVQQLRDPCLFEEDGRTYLFYSIAGEMGIAMAEIKLQMKNDPGPAPPADAGKPAG